MGEDTIDTISLLRMAGSPRRADEDREGPSLGTHCVKLNPGV